MAAPGILLITDCMVFVGGDILSNESGYCNLKSVVWNKSKHKQLSDDSNFKCHETLWWIDYQLFVLALFAQNKERVQAQE